MAVWIDMSHKTSNKLRDVYIMIYSYASFKGILILTVAMIIHKNQLLSLEYRTTFLFFANSQVFFSVILNSLILKFFIKKLPQNRNDMVQMKIEDGIRKHLILQTYEQRLKFMGNPFY